MLVMRAGENIKDRYRLEQPLGRGGMAEVWRATDERLSRPVAIKFLDARLIEHPEFLVRFFAEAQSVARLTHPNVVAVFDFGAVEDGSYLVTEYVGGGALSELVSGPLEPERALDIVRQAARGAGAAHAIGVVHRDIKPGNILLTEDGRPKLADFGIAAAQGGERLTGTDQALGSPHYISPEQVEGEPGSPASDVYALGVVLYELLTGSKPFTAESVTALAIQHVERDPDPPSTLVAGLDPGIDALVLRCLAKDPNRRFHDGNALADAIESGQLRVTSSGRLRRRLRRLRGGRGGRRSKALAGGRRGRDRDDVAAGCGRGSHLRRRSAGRRSQHPQGAARHAGRAQPRQPEEGQRRSRGRGHAAGHACTLTCACPGERDKEATPSEQGAAEDRHPTAATTEQVTGATADSGRHTEADGCATKPAALGGPVDARSLSRKLL